ncbi:DNA-binding protein [Bacillus paranthracis]|uniref:DNA-binding protein n=1 Tax=Bacillus paranthracis TaxID=2026186 RepID=UPI0022563606|nr:DNA-binding protein [Bacillus paranthracis]
MNDIDKYMTPSEAAYRWGIPESTLKNKLQNTSIVGSMRLNFMLEQGLIKFFVKPSGERKEWIISEEAMKIWFPK